MAAATVRIASVVDRLAAGLALVSMVGLAALLAGGSAAAAAALLLRDDLQRAVRIARPPQRIVSLLPSITETVCALGECARLVATDRYSNWPAAVLALPKAGGLDDAQIEAIVAARPDLVLLAASARVTARLEQLGVTTFAIEPRSYADIARSTTVLAQLLGVPACGDCDCIEPALRLQRGNG